MFETVAGPRLG